MNYCWSDKKINTIIQNFLDMAFKSLIDFINDQLSMEMIVYDEEAKAMGGNTYIQNIETVNGSASQQNSGVINTYNTTNDTGSMLELIDKLLASLPEIQGVDAEEIENVKDDLEMVQEQLKTDNPKKNRIRKSSCRYQKVYRRFFYETCSNTCCRSSYQKSIGVCYCNSLGKLY